MPMNNLRDLSTKAKLNFKNMLGWKTRRKIIVLAFDDYGNVRLDSKVAREKLDLAGMPVKNRFDAYDTLETREDLEMIYNVLVSVKDQNGRNAILTPFSVPCNINFEKMADDNYNNYYYEILPQTYSKLSLYDPASYKGAWDLWKEGLSKGLMTPQFHGREHLNLKVFEEKLKRKGKEILTALKNRSYTGISESGYSTISYTAAFDFWEFTENSKFELIIEDGLNNFEEVFGFRSVHFNPPGGREHPIIHGFLAKNGIKYIDTPWIKKEHLGNQKYRTVINYSGKRNNLNMIYQVRNVVFEPTENRGLDWVAYTLKQIETAFYWNRPAIISSHRVNYCGHISEKNRSIGLSALKSVLKEVVRKWPDIEFMSSVDALDFMSGSS